VTGDNVVKKKIMPRSQTGSWYLLGILFKTSAELSHPFYLEGLGVCPDVALQVYSGY